MRIPSESDLVFDPQPGETSAVRWWDPAELSDPQVRDKVIEQLGDIRPLLKARWEDFHQRTDEMVAAYAPEVRDAMQSILEGDAVRRAAQAAYSAEKGVSDYRAQLSALVTRALGILREAPRSLGRLRSVLGRMYREAWTQGEKEAAEAVGVAYAGNDMGLSALLASLDIRIRGISDTLVDRIGMAIEHAIEQPPVVPDALHAEIASIIDDEARAVMIADTELTRAYGMAAMDAYRAMGVTMVAWLHQPGACARCMENAAASPIPIDQQWPGGNLPVHPNERCAIAPYIAPNAPRPSAPILP